MERFIAFNKEDGELSIMVDLPAEILTAGLDKDKKESVMRRVASIKFATMDGRVFQFIRDDTTTIEEFARVRQELIRRRADGGIPIIWKWVSNYKIPEEV